MWSPCKISEKNYRTYDFALVLVSFSRGFIFAFFGDSEGNLENTYMYSSKNITLIKIRFFDFLVTPHFQTMK